MDNPCQEAPKMNISCARIGYARVSTADQSLDARWRRFEAAGCTMVCSVCHPWSVIRQAA